MGNRITSNEAKNILEAFWNGEWRYVDDNIGPTCILLNGKRIHLFLVSQGKSYETESLRGHLYSLQRGYPKMKEVQPGDIIFHYSKEEIKAISIALEEAEETYGTEDGLRIDCFLSELKFPLEIKPLRSILADYTPFNNKGHVPQSGYIHPLHVHPAKIMLDEIKKLGNTPR